MSNALTAQELADECKRLVVEFARAIYENANKQVQTSFDHYDQHHARMGLHAAIDRLRDLAALASQAEPVAPNGWQAQLLEVGNEYATFQQANPFDVLAKVRKRLSALSTPPAPAQAEPIDRVLHCPACGMQHIDAPKDHPLNPWLNPPHRSHLCHGCGHIWRPADVPTNGVQAVKTKGKADSPIVRPALPAPDDQGKANAVLLEALQELLAALRFSNRPPTTVREAEAKLDRIKVAAAKATRAILIVRKAKEKP